MIMVKIYAITVITSSRWMKRYDEINDPKISRRRQYVILMEIDVPRA